MKKIITGFIIVLFLLLCVSMIVSLNKDIKDIYSYYSIPRNYALYEINERKITFDVYTNEKNSIISFPEKNRYQIKINNSNFQINDIDVSVRKELNKNENIYVYSFSFDINEISYQCENENISFMIINDEFRLKLFMGNLTIYRFECELLDFVDLYGNFTYIDNELHLIGITIALDKKYRKLEKILSGSVKVNLSKMKKDIIYDSEISKDDIDFDVVGYYEECDYSLNADTTYYFIPLLYEKLLLNINPCFIFYIDGTPYLLDNFLYYVNDINLSNYETIKKAGEVIYA